jgi:NADH:ubiquinone oxidoreductase subunit 6 (subunit J)
MDITKIEQIDIIAVIMLSLLISFFVAIFIQARVYCVIFLVLSYALVATIAALFSLNFIAVAVLIIYVGAISVFFLFIVMCLNEQKISTAYDSNESIVSAVFFIIILGLNLSAVWFFFKSLDSSIGSSLSWFRGVENGSFMKFFFIDSSLHYWTNSGSASRIIGEGNSSTITAVYEINNSLDSISNNSNLTTIDPDFFRIVDQVRAAVTASKSKPSLLDHWITTNEHVDSTSVFSESTARVAAAPSTEPLITQIIESNDIVNVGMQLYTRFAVSTISGALLLLLAIVGVTAIFDIIPKSNKSREVIIEQLVRKFQIK